MTSTVLMHSDFPKSKKLFDFIKFELFGLPRKIFCGNCDSLVSGKHSFCWHCSKKLKLGEVRFE